MMKGKKPVIILCVLDVVLLGLSVFLYVGEDRMAPEIAFGEEAPVYREGMEEEELLAGVTAMDDRDGDVTGSLLVEKVSGTGEGTVIVTYVARDGSNNVGKVSRILEARGGADRDVE